MDKENDLAHIDQIFIQWARHHRNFREDLGYSTQEWQKISLRVDFDQMVQTSDDQISAAVDAILYDFDDKLRKAVEHVYLGHTWDLQDDSENCLAEAQKQMGERLIGRGFYVAQKTIA